jgi:23S rRNA (uracil1939-C5)-methyltransferase
MASSPSDIILNISSMAYGGNGVARKDGKVFFVADAIEGDVVKARVVEDKERYANAEITEFVTLSTHRLKPRCAFIQSCGGCQWMGVPYNQQLAWKRDFILGSLKRIGKIPENIEVEVKPSPEIYNYRNRIMIRVHISERSSLVCGYFKRGTRDLVPITRCDIANETINKLIAHITSMDLSGIQSVKFRMEIQELPAGSGKLAVTLTPGDGDRLVIKVFAEALKSLDYISWSGMSFDLKDAPMFPFDEQFDRTFLTIPGQFQQVNVDHNKNLRAFIGEIVNKLQPTRILDVFCGSGNLSIGIAGQGRTIEGVEFNSVAIDCAKKNVALNDLNGAVFYAGDAEKHLLKLSRSNSKFDLVILDPPRQGFHKGMSSVKTLSPKHIIYVSCDPTTLARDIGYLCRESDYKINSITGFDFFPNTYHVETVVVLERER